VKIDRSFFELLGGAQVTVFWFVSNVNIKIRQAETFVPDTLWSYIKLLLTMMKQYKLLKTVESCER
jgi:hypothetical protein